MKKISFFLSFVFGALAVVAEWIGGYALYSIPLAVFVFLPLFDIALGRDASNPKEEEISNLQNEFFYRYVTYAWAFFQLAFVIWILYRIASIPRSHSDFFLSALGVGIVTGGVGITVGHELGHKNTKWEQFLARMIYMTVCYMHFQIEHNLGHHVHVATEKDPATSRKGESFYVFYPRTVFGSILSAWKIEAKRLMKQGNSVFSWRNEMVYCLICPLCFIGIVAFVLSAFGFSGILSVIVFFFLQSFIAFTLLELVNYIEHYGLVRKQVAPGKFERVMPIHSWNQNFLLSNALLFQLQRHSDHHANAGRRYQTLRHFDEAPQLPFGYEVMVLIALVPPLWFFLMDPKLEAWEKKYT